MTFPINVSKSAFPYNFLIAEDFFPEDISVSIQRHVQNIGHWRLHVEPFFEQYEYLIKREEFPLLDDCADKVRSYLEVQFNTTLSNTTHVAAHKLVKGQKISVHNDCPALGYETHRLVINLNEDYSDERGGHFYICSKRSSEDIFKILRPILNSGFAFVASKNSYHAVGEVLEGQRYSIVFSYHHIGNTAEIKAHIHAALESARNMFLGNVSSIDMEALTSLKMDQIKNLKNTLFDHLLETYCILKSWGESDFTARIGLYHSVLGSKKFNLPNANKADDLLQTIDPMLHQAVSIYKHFDPQTFNQDSSPLQSALLKVFYANLFTGRINWAFDEQIWMQDKLLYLSHRNLLSDKAADDLNKLFSV